MTAPNVGGPLILNEADRYVVDEILEPARPQEKRGVTVNEGYRFVALGETGSGKTSLMRVVVYSTLARGLANFALIHDTKNIWPEYPRSVQVRNVAEFRRRGFRSGEILAVSFRGDPRAGVEVSAEEVAAYSVLIARQGVQKQGQWHTNPHVTVIEELSEAATGGRKKLDSHSVLKLLEQGRKMGVSLVGTTQSPANVPLDILRQASAIAYFRMTGPDVNYLRERLHLPERFIRAVSGVGDGGNVDDLEDAPGLPNHEFCLRVKGKPWDGKIHKLDKRTALMFE